MVGLLGFATYLVRALHLLALSLLPSVLSPEPRSPEGAALPLEGALAFVFFGLLLYGAARLRARVASRAARVGAVLVWVATATALVAALVCSHERAPLARGLVYVAVPVWAAILAFAVAMASRWPGWTWAPRRWAVALAVIALAGGSVYRARPLYASTTAMWWNALELDTEHTLAATELAAPALRERKFDQAEAIVDSCLMRMPGACACLDLRSRIALQGRRPEAVAIARVGSQRCPGFGQARATLAEALAQQGDLAAAEQEARLGLVSGGPGDRLHYVLALIFERRGEYAEARGEVQQALDLGAGRDAKLLAAALAILTHDDAAAKAMLGPLSAADPSDAEVAYNLALIADQKGDFNGARQGYLAALKADPKNASARYNLALLTWRFGVKEESQHHLQKFRESFPSDPRGFQLAQTLASPPPKR